MVIDFCSTAAGADCATFVRALALKLELDCLRARRAYLCVEVVDWLRRFAADFAGVFLVGVVERVVWRRECASARTRMLHTREVGPALLDMVPTSAGALSARRGAALSGHCRCGDCDCRESCGEKCLPVVHNAPPSCVSVLIGGHSRKI